MAKIKVKKQSTWIDMTAMSDVTVLLLTFFMLTSVFIRPEPIQVTTPSSVSDRKVPESNLMTILVDSKGKVFFSMDNQNDMLNTLTAVGEDYGISFTPKQQNSFKILTSFGVPMRYMGDYLNLPDDKQVEFLKDLTSAKVGIPTSDAEVRDGNVVISTDNEFKRWISHATTINPDLQIAIKADQNTGFPVIKKVMDDLGSLRKYKYLLITSLKTSSSDEG